MVVLVMSTLDMSTNGTEILSCGGNFIERSVSTVYMSDQEILFDVLECDARFAEADDEIPVIADHEVLAESTHGLEGLPLDQHGHEGKAGVFVLTEIGPREARDTKPLADPHVLTPHVDRSGAQQTLGET